MSSWIYPAECWSAVVLAVVSSRKLRARIAADGPEGLIWAVVLSLMLGFAAEGLNWLMPLWTHLGLPFGEPGRTLAQGLSFAAIAPTVLAVAFWISPRAPLSTARRPPEIFLPVGFLFIAAGALLRGVNLDGALACAYLGVLLTVDAANSRAGRPSLIASLWSGEKRFLVGLSCGAAAWAAVDRLGGVLAPPGRIYIGFSKPLWLWPILVLQALTLWACYVAAAAALDRPLFLLPPPDKEHLKIFD